MGQSLKAKPKIPDKLGLIALKSFRRAVRAVREEHRKLGLPMVVEIDGKICHIKPWLKSTKRKTLRTRKIKA
jgi:hypothetical protein